MSSSVPAVITAFMTLAAGALPADTQVYFGKRLGVYEAPLTLQILGIIDGEQAVAELGPDYKREEVYELNCLLCSFTGDTGSDVYLKRMQADFADFALLEIAIANNPTLNGSCRFAEIRRLDYTPETDARGMTLGYLPFTVAVQVRIDSLRLYGYRG